MKSYTVTYFVDDEQQRRLEALRDRLAAQGTDLTVRGLFFGLMSFGSAREIDEKLSFAEGELLGQEESHG